MKKSLYYKIIGGVVAIFILIQLIPVNRDNPPESVPIKAPQGITQILERSCYDCHSNRTKWPWYSYVAPISWLVARDVHEGREHLNFSVWDGSDAEEIKELSEEFIKVLQEDEMPLWFYLPLHPQARLSEIDKQLLIEWAEKGFPSH